MNLVSWVAQQMKEAAALRPPLIEAKGSGASAHLRSWKGESPLFKRTGVGRARALKQRDRDQRAVIRRDAILCVDDLAVFVDDEVATGDTHELLTVALTFLPDAVGLTYLLVFVHKKGEREV